MRGVDVNKNKDAQIKNVITLNNRKSITLIDGIQAENTLAYDEICSPRTKKSVLAGKNNVYKCSEKLLPLKDFIPERKSDHSVDFTVFSFVRPF